MAEVKFGTGQVNNPTPAGINLWVRIFTIVGGIFIGWMQTTNLIGPMTQGAISSILGLLLAIVNGLAPLFGVDISSKTVPTEKVTAIDTKEGV
jgi:hypothetical protein